MKRLLLVAMLSACGTPAPEAPRSTAPTLREGAELYARYCALCHGESGEGYAADNATRLNGQSLLRTASDAFLTTAIAEGRRGTAMGAYGREHGGPLTASQVDALVTLIRSWQEGPDIDVDAMRVSGDADAGRELYAAHCASCHGPDGRGGSAQSLTAESFLRTASDGFLRYAIVHGREGTPMPGFEDALSGQEIDDLVASLRAFEEDAGPSASAAAVPTLEGVPILRHPDGPAPQFTLREERYVPAAQVSEAVAAGSRLILLDARPTSDWLRLRLPGALPVPYYDITPVIERLPRDGTWIVAYCGCPHAASGRVVDTLREAGFENTAVLDEGVFHWVEQGYPTERGPVEPQAAED